MLLGLRKERWVLLRGIIATLRIPWLGRRVAARKDWVCLRFGKVMCVIDRSEGRRLEGSRYLMGRWRESRPGRLRWDGRRIGRVYITKDNAARAWT